MLVRRDDDVASVGGVQHLSLLWLNGSYSALETLQVTYRWGFDVSKLKNDATRNRFCTLLVRYRFDALEEKSIGTADESSGQLE